MRRDESIRVVSKVAAELTMVPRSDEVFRRLSRGHVTAADLDEVCRPAAPLLTRAAAFVDTVISGWTTRRGRPLARPTLRRAVLRRPGRTGRPLDLRPGQHGLHGIRVGWRRIPGLTRYPLPETDDDPGRTPTNGSSGSASGSASWRRIRRRAHSPGRRRTRSCAPTSPSRWTIGPDAKRSAEGKLTVTDVLTEVHRLLGRPRLGLRTRNSWPAPTRANWP